MLSTTCIGTKPSAMETSSAWLEQRDPRANISNTYDSTYDLPTNPFPLILNPPQFLVLEKDPSVSYFVGVVIGEWFTKGKFDITHCNCRLSWACCHESMNNRSALSGDLSVFPLPSVRRCRKNEIVASSARRAESPLIHGLTVSDGAEESKKIGILHFHEYKVVYFR